MCKQIPCAIVPLAVAVVATTLLAVVVYFFAKLYNEPAVEE